MRSTRFALALAAGGLLAAVAAGAATPDGQVSQAPATTHVDPTSYVSPGGPLTGVVGPITVRMKDIQTGDPNAIPGLLRGHDQGWPEEAGEPDFFSGRPEDDRGAVFGPQPTSLPGDRPLPQPDAPGDLRRDFVGQTASGWLPPDPVLAVGPKYIVEVVNSGFTVFTKDGGLDRAYTDLQTFFTPVMNALPCAPADCFVFDPRVTFEHVAYNKFVIEALARDDTNHKSYFLWAISQTDNPLGNWWMWGISNQDGTNSWADYAGMTADQFGIYFTANNWLWAGGFSAAMELSMRPDVFNGTWNGGWYFGDIRWNEAGNPQAFDIQPVVEPYTWPGDQKTFFTNTFNGPGNEVNLCYLSGDRGSGPTFHCDSVTVSAYDNPGLAHQPAPGADDIEMFYAGTQNNAYSQRNVYVALNDAGSGNSGFYVSKINVDSLTEAVNRTYYTGGYYYYYPNVTLFGSDTFNPFLAVAMSFSSDSIYASGAFKFYQQFTVDTSGSFWGVAGGSADYNVYFNGRNRWGDYMGVARDATCDTAWSVTEYAPSLNTWSTAISEMLGDTAQTGVCNLIFDDGFERGSAGNWSSVAP